MEPLNNQLDNFTLIQDSLTAPLSFQKFERRDPIIFFYIPLDCPSGKKCLNSSCIFSHTKLETIFHPIIYRTKACQKYRNGKCEYEDRCTFYHNSAERNIAEAAWGKWENKWNGWREEIPEKIKEKFSNIDGFITKLESIMKIHISNLNSQISKENIKFLKLPEELTKDSFTFPFRDNSNSFSLQFSKSSNDPWFQLQNTYEPFSDNNDNKNFQNQSNNFITNLSNKNLLLDNINNSGSRTDTNSFNLNLENQNSQNLLSYSNKSHNNEMNNLNDIFGHNQFSLDEKELILSKLQRNNFYPQNHGLSNNYLEPMNSSIEKLSFDSTVSGSNTTSPTVTNSVYTPTSTMSPAKTFITQHGISSYFNLPIGLMSFPTIPTSNCCKDYNELYNIFISVLYSLNLHIKNCSNCNIALFEKVICKENCKENQSCNELSTSFPLIQQFDQHELLDFSLNFSPERYNINKFEENQNSKNDFNSACFNQYNFENQNLLDDSEHSEEYKNNYDGTITNNLLPTNK